MNLNKKKKSILLIYYYVGRLKPDATTYASPTANPNANGIHTPKVSILIGTLSCCSKLPNMSIFFL
jgi:hypothetical protein